MIIALEGIDGSGKATLLKKVNKELSKTNTTFSVSFPVYEGVFGKQIGDYLSGRIPKPDAKSLALWYALDRLEAFYNLPYPVDYFLFDRFSLSSFAFLGVEHWEFLFDLEHDLLSLPIPDFYFILDIDPKIAFTRNLQKKNREYTDGLDVNEKDIKKQELARENYLLLQRDTLFKGKSKIIVLDALETPDILCKEVIYHVKEKMRNE